MTELPLICRHVLQPPTMVNGPAKLRSDPGMPGSSRELGTPARFPALRGRDIAIRAITVGSQGLHWQEAGLRLEPRYVYICTAM